MLRLSRAPSSVGLSAPLSLPKLPTCGDTHFVYLMRVFLEFTTGRSHACTSVVNIREGERGRDPHRRVKMNYKHRYTPKER